MASDRGIELWRTDVVSFLGGLASRLRVHGQALHGMAAVEGYAASIEGREKSEMAGDLEAVATYLDLLREHLCPACRLIEMVERLSINGGAGVKNSKPAR